MVNISVFLYDSSILLKFPDETSWEIHSLSSLEMILNRHYKKKYDKKTAIDVCIESGITRFRLIQIHGLSWLDRMRLLIKLYREEPYAEQHDAITLQKKSHRLVVGSTHLTDFARDALLILGHYSIASTRLWYQSWTTDRAEQRDQAILLHDLHDLHDGEKLSPSTIHQMSRMVLIDEGSIVLARQTKGFHQQEDQKQIVERLSVTTKKEIFVAPWYPQKRGNHALLGHFFYAKSRFLQKSMSQYKIQNLLRKSCIMGIILTILLTAVTPWLIASIQEETDTLHAKMARVDPSPAFLRREIPSLLSYESILKQQKHPFVLLTPCIAVFSALTETFSGAVMEDLLWEADKKILSFKLKTPSLMEQTHDNTFQELAEHFKAIHFPFQAKIHPLAQKNLWSIHISSDHLKK